MVVETTKEQIVLNQIIGQKKELRTVECIKYNKHKWNNKYI